MNTDNIKQFRQHGVEIINLSKNDSFKELANSFAAIALNCENKESFLNADFDGMTVAEKLIEQTGVIGEKIQINDFNSCSVSFPNLLKTVDSLRSYKNKKH